MALLTMVGELRLAQWVEFKPRISPLSQMDPTKAYDGTVQSARARDFT